MKGIVSWFAENHVAANLLMIFLLLAGVVTGLTMKLEIFPETSLDRITITMAYPGASPAEVEEAIVRRIEEKVAVFMKVAEGLHAMHRHGFVHADIKPNNVLLSPDGGLKIIDFGQSCPMGHRKERIQGTPD